eukprot:CAMPEP_0115674256 /NCGR_PEP_ID=MMETSP0272-20121206/53526_1 /TAXON_ID=71861 /ORGANISM="Scrippsiella trochoidea, Strain CCMP3099" /LENGTH=58 /DNA_ID=CAMNT_0003113157 /DNA_START=559 /DNA_END=735 /DNA_ORIENTATION=-
MRHWPVLRGEEWATTTGACNLAFAAQRDACPAGAPANLPCDKAFVIISSSARTWRPRA